MEVLVDNQWTIKEYNAAVRLWRVLLCEGFWVPCPSMSRLAPMNGAARASPGSTSAARTIIRRLCFRLFGRICAVNRLLIALKPRAAGEVMDEAAAGGDLNPPTPLPTPLPLPEQGEDQRTE